MYTTLFILRKRLGQHIKATDVTSLQPCHLFYVTDHNSVIHFLVGTGAQVSVIPPLTLDKNLPSTLTLQAVNNTTFRTYGTRSLTLNLGQRQNFRWVFVIADVRNAILGAEFLQQHNLLVDMRQQRLSDTTTKLTVQKIASAARSPSPSLLPQKPTTQFEAILSEFPAITHLCATTTPVNTKLPTTSHVSVQGIQKTG